MMKAPVADKVKLTVEQYQAIETRDCSVSLSAGAGCGKTFVLTERFLSYFDPRRSGALQPAELGQLVAITFTERAAREMRDRIRKKCAERLLTADAEAAEYWSELVRSLDSARISTIHSFCASLVRSHAVESGIDPQFAVLEQSQADALLSEAVDDQLRLLIAAKDPTTLDLAVRFDLDPLHAMARRLVLDCNDAQNAEWSRIGPAEQVARWRAFHQDQVLPKIVAQIVNSPSAGQVLDLLRKHTPTHPVMQARRAVLLETLGGLVADPASNQGLPARLQAIHEAARVQGGGAAKTWSNAEAFEDFKNAATELRKVIDGVLDKVEFDDDAAMEAAVVGKRLLELASSIRATYSERKQVLAALDFNDLLDRGRQLLTDPRHAGLQARIAGQIQLLLVDEFQDTDPLQVQLVAALCGASIADGKLFCVGDHKQSIYRFRGANPHVFRRLRDDMPQAGQLSLTHNFRSQPAILEFVNALFRHALGDEYEPLRATRDQVSPKPAIEFLWAVAPPDSKEKSEALRRREADWIARRIREILDAREPMVWDAEAAASGQPRARAAQPGDIAMLFRALSDVEVYEEALRRYGIDYYLVGGRAFYAQQEVFDLLNVLRVLDSPSDVVSLAGALRSGFFSLMDEAIFWLAQHPGGLAAGLFDETYPTEIPADQQRQAHFAATTIRELRAAKDQMRIGELIEEILARTGYDATLLNEFLGERKLANLRKLVEQARDFQRGGFFGLSEFITQLADFVARQPDEALAATHSENTNVVRLMTIHQSKGLEFPIVIVPDLARSRQSTAPQAHFDETLGPLVKLPDDGGTRNILSGHELWQFAERDEDLAELRRLLYVATTRAADYLILSSGVLELDKASGPWMQLLSSRFDLSSGALKGELAASETRPAIRVTTESPPASRTASTRRAPIDWEQIAAGFAEPTALDAELTRAVGSVAPDSRARRQFSFSRLAGTVERSRDVPGDGDAAQGPSLDARELGNLVHQALAAIEFGRPTDVPSLVERYAGRQLSPDRAMVDEACALVERFLASPRAQQLAAAQANHAEVEFLLSWPGAGSEDVGSQARDRADGLLLTGFIDRLYRDAAGDWHVLDFKTNRVAASNVDQQAAAYEMQMLVYGLATEQILGVAPKSLILHFLRTGAEHPFVWNDTARRRVVSLIDAGIARATSLAESDAV